MTEHRRAAKENRAVDRLKFAAQAEYVSMYGERGNGLPILVSELFDHRSCLPLFHNQLFRPVKHATVNLPSGLTEEAKRLREVFRGLDFPAREPKGEKGALLNAIRSIDFPLSLNAEINKHNLSMLKELNGLTAVKELNLSLVFDPEKDPQTGVYRYNVDLDFKLTLPELDQFRVTLAPGIDQAKQLGVFAPMAHLKHLSVTNLNQDGAAYLSAAAQDFPALKHLDIDFEFPLAWDKKAQAYWNDTDRKLQLPEVDETSIRNNNFGCSHQ